MSFDEVVGENVKRLRRSRKMTAAGLADELTDWTGWRYTRYTVLDLEGRRERQVRWSELVALCNIFKVPLWELVLPHGDERVHGPIEDRVVDGKPLGPEPAVYTMGIESPDQPDVQIELVTEPAGRSEVAWLLFGRNDEDLASEAYAAFRRDERERERREVEEIVEAVVEGMRKRRER